MFLFLSPFPRLLFEVDLTAEWMKQCSWEQSMANTFVTVPDGYGLPEPIQYYGEWSKFCTLERRQNELQKFISFFFFILSLKHWKALTTLLLKVYWNLLFLSIIILLLLLLLLYRLLSTMWLFWLSIPYKHAQCCLPLTCMEKTQVLLQYSRDIINR